MYQPYPGGTQEPGPLHVPEPPAITNAVRLMYAGAAASVIGIVLDVVTAGPMRAQIAKLAPTLTAAQVNSLYHIQVAFLIIAGLIGAGAWVGLAIACKSGRGWARIVATVLFVLDTVSVIFGFARGAALGAGAGRVYGILVWLIGLAVIVLLWQRPASAYFQGRRQR